MRILIIEDDVSLVTGLRKLLSPAGIAVDHEADGQSAIAVARSEPYALIVIDLGLPGLSGGELLRLLRRDGSDVPILILTATDAVDEKVRCLNMGADDYLTKPFAPNEFEARVRALARRGQRKPNPVLTSGCLSFDSSSSMATLNGVPLQLRRREAAVLAVLMAHAGKLVRKERLHSEVFSFDEAVAPNAIELYVARLRRKLAPDGPRITTVKGLGYLIEAL